MYLELLEWSKKRPVWQRDALRRLATGVIDEDDLGELEWICLQEEGYDLPEDKKIEPQPLLVEHLPVKGNADSVVTLASISNIQNVNLISGESGVSFGAKGLTVIYGYNGSGKSGFSRILKRICRSRDGGAPIIPNVFEKHDGSPASASLDYFCDDKKQSHAWVDAKESPKELGGVTAFDSNCAEFYVTRENDVAYRPFGLDLFDRLASIADKVHARLEERKNGLSSQCDPPPLELVEDGGLKGIYPVTPRTDPKTVEAVTELDANEKKELEELKRALAEDQPEKKAASLRARAGRLRNVVANIEHMMKLTSHQASSEYKQHLTELTTAKEAARIASEEAFGDLLPATGGDAWREVWEHARKYNEQAYSGATFPNVDDGALCLLCQQTLDDSAKKRLLGFEEYVKKETSSKLNVSGKTVEQDLKALRDVIIADKDDNESLNELKSHSDKWESDYIAFVKASRSAAVSLTQDFKTGEWRSIESPRFDVSDIRATIDRLESEARSTLLSTDEEVTKKRNARVKVLEIKNWISSNKDVLISDITRAKQRQAVDKSIQTTHTNSISSQSKVLTNKYVTKALKDAFIEELDAMGANELGITLTSRPGKGTTFHKVDIKDRELDHVPVKDIVSEGEFRAIALAAFFAELDQSPGASAIVIDDPVSSLDHLHRERVAKRIVQESEKRQVIVLTHEVQFLRTLTSQAEGAGVELTLRQVTRGSKSVGLVSDDVPWDTQKVKQRLHVLRNKAAELQKLYDENRQTYESVGRDWYGHLRDAWEVLVEELVLNGCIQRLDFSVQTKRLKKLVDDVTEDDYKTIEAGMDRCSRWMRGHAKPVVDDTPFPEPSELLKDFDFLCNYYETIKKRRN